MVAALGKESDSNSDDQSQTDRLMLAARTGDSAELTLLLARHVDVNSTTESGMTALMNAAAHGNLETVQLLLAHGATLHTARYDGFTALDLAAFFGHESIVRELVRYGARLESQTRSQTNAQMWANARGLFSIADLLKEAGARHAGEEERPVVRLGPTPSPNPPSNGAEEEVVEKATPQTQSSASKGATAVNIEMRESSRKPAPSRRVLDETSLLDFEYPVKPAAPFSPFSALADRLGGGRWRLVLTLLVTMLLATGGTVAALKIFRRDSQVNAATKQVALPIVEDGSGANSRTQSPVKMSAESQTSSHDSTNQPLAASSSSETIESPTDQSERSDENHRALSAPPAQNEKFRGKRTPVRATRAIESVRTSDQRPIASLSDGNSSDTSRSRPAIRVMEPAAPQAPRVRTTGNSTQAGSQTPLGIQSTKKKVIQWP